MRCRSVLIYILQWTAVVSKTLRIHYFPKLHKNLTSIIYSDKGGRCRVGKDQNRNAKETWFSNEFDSEACLNQNKPQVIFVQNKTTFV